MSNFIDEQDIDDFFAWLKNQLPESEADNSLSPPSPELLELAWQAAQAQQRNDLNADLKTDYFSVERLIPLAAADGTLRDAAVRIDSIGGEWSLTRETLPDDPDWQVLKFKCREELIDEFQDRQVQVAVGEQLFNLGKVNRRGVAESEVPSGMDLSQSIDVRIFIRENDSPKQE